METSDIFKIRLKASRKRKKLTQEELAKRIKTTKGTISNYENGYSTPSNEALVLIAKATDVSVDYLLGNTDSPAPPNIDKDEEKFQAFANDPSLQKWYKELPKSKEEDLRKLRKMWEILRDNGEI